MDTNTTTARRDLALALVAFAIAFVLWQSSPLVALVYPFRLFVTFVHELGHGMATLATGGEFIRFELKSSGAGLAYSRGGIRSLIIPAGYVGTAIFGATLLYATNRTRRAEWIAIGLGGFLALLSILYTGISTSNLNTLERFTVLIPMIAGIGYFLIAEEDRGRLIGGGTAFVALLLGLYLAAGDNTLALMVGVISGAVLVAIGIVGMLGYRDVTRFTLNFLAFVVGLNAITDAWFLLRIVSNDNLIIRNDATAMSEQVGLPASFWALMWILTAVVLFGSSVWLTFFKPMQDAREEPLPWKD